MHAEMTYIEVMEYANTIDSKLHRRYPTWCSYNAAAGSYVKAFSQINLLNW